MMPQSTAAAWALNATPLDARIHGHDDEGAIEVASAPSRFNLRPLLPAVIGMACAALFFMRGWHRLSKERWRPFAFDPLSGLLLIAAFMLAAPLGIGIARQWLAIPPDTPFDDFTLAQLVVLSAGRYAAEAMVACVFLVIVLRAKFTAEAQRSESGQVNMSTSQQVNMPFRLTKLLTCHHSLRLCGELGRGIGRAALIGAGALALFWPMTMLVAFIVSAMVYMIHGQSPDPIAHETLAMLLAAERDAWFFAMVGLVLIAAPVLEEVLYRGLLQETIIRLGAGRWPAIFATSAIFAAMHYTVAPEPIAVPGVLASLFVLSLGFGLVYEKTGRLMAPIVMHVLFNAGNLALAMML